MFTLKEFYDVSFNYAFSLSDEYGQRFTDPYDEGKIAVLNIFAYCVVREIECEVDNENNRVIVNIIISDITPDLYDKYDEYVRHKNDRIKCPTDETDCPYWDWKTHSCTMLKETGDHPRYECDAYYEYAEDDE